MAHNVHLFDHPLVQHKLTLLRKKETSTTSFRRLLSESSSIGCSGKPVQVLKSSARDLTIVQPTFLLAGA